MIKKIVCVSIIGLLISSIISCEKDFTEVGTTIIDNSAFETKDTLLEITMSPMSLEAVRADNIALGTLGEYWLGVYNPVNYKKIEASIISQLGFKQNPNTAQTSSEQIDSVYTFDGAIVKIPYKVSQDGTDSDNNPKFKFDALLGDNSTASTIKVYRNQNFLNSLNPSDPSKQNSYQSNYLSNYSFSEEDNLTKDGSYSFLPKISDTQISINRKTSTGVGYDEAIKYTENKIDKPFLAIPLNSDKIETIFWNKFSETEFSSKELFDEYFRGIILKSEGNDGSLVSLDLSKASLEVYYTATALKKGTQTLVDKKPKSYSFPFSGININNYKMPTTQASTSNNSIKVQGTAGSAAELNILLNNQLQELRSKKWLLNDASLTFYVDQNIDQDTASIPQRLFLYKNLTDKNGNKLPVQISDSYVEPELFDGNIKNSNKKPEKYTLRITNYISKILKGEEEVSSLTLRTFNSTDTPVVNNSLDTIVKTYNWNPRGVTLLNNSTTNGDKKAVLKISYTEEK